MNFEEYARMNEQFLEMTPTQMVNVVDRTNFEGQEEMAFKMWTKSYPNNGSGESGLISRLTNVLNMEEEDITTLSQTYGGLSEALYDIMVGSPEGNPVYVQDVYGALYTDSWETTYEQYFELLPRLSSLGRKWLTAFVLKETRHGCGETAVKKMLSKSYGLKAAEIKKASHFLSLDDVIHQVISTGSIDYVPVAGNYMKPMLAKTGNYSHGRRWCDYKYDGIRAQVHQNEDGIKIFNRKGDDITSKFENDLIPLIKENTDPVDWIADGEIYPVDTEGNPAEFKNIMSRIHGKTDDVIYRNPVTIRLFDCLMYGGQPVFDDNLDTRLQTLEMHFDESIVAKTTEIQNEDEMLEFYTEAIEAGFEGVIIKDPNLSYEFGKRSKGWEKYKPPLVDVDCIVTGVNAGAGKRAGTYGAYHIALKDGDELVSLGLVGSGFTDEDLAFLKNIYDNKGDNNMIIEVKGDMLTQNENGEYGLRFPRFVKYRDDKSEPTQLKEVKQ